MFEVRIHGRGGQGVVTAAEMLSVAAFLEGKHAQAFPSFGSERMGAPVVAFCRIDDHEIRCANRSEPGCADRPGPDPAQGARRVRGPQGERLSDRQHDARRSKTCGCRRCLRATPSPFRRPSWRSSTSAALRPTRRCSAASRRSRPRLARLRRRGDPPRLPRPRRRSQCRGRPRGLRAVSAKIAADGG